MGRIFIKFEGTYYLLSQLEQNGFFCFFLFLLLCLFGFCCCPSSHSCFCFSSSLCHVSNWQKNVLANGNAEGVQTLQVRGYRSGGRVQVYNTWSIQGSTKVCLFYHELSWEWSKEIGYGCCLKAERSSFYKDQTLSE